jgi:predicted glycogen debranching enzyme
MGRFERDDREWLEADGLGGFASGTVSGVRTRRYHALLLSATAPPAGRVVLVNGFDAWVENDGRRQALSSQRYAPDATFPDGATRIEAFAAEPWPAWTFALAGGLRVRQEILVVRDRAATVLTWRLLDDGAATPAGVRLVVRPFLSGRDYHATHHENGACGTGAEAVGERVVWRCYAGVPGVVSRANASYAHQPDWYRRFLYEAERRRGLDDTEDLLAPGWLTFDLSAGEAVWILEAEPSAAGEPDAAVPAIDAAQALRAAERTRRAALASPVHRAADAYLVRRGAGRTIVAGYPWFTDWGRDTFIALRGLCLATGRYDDARQILREWSTVVSEGMLPNRFPDSGDTPEFNAVDASLWFVVCVSELLDAADAGLAALPAAERDGLRDAVLRIVEGYARGTRYGIRLDADGLLACGVPGVQLTWMDAKVGDRVITPRAGKPVEVQALWLYALRVAAAIDPHWQAVLRNGRASFVERFWNAEGGCLYDVVDVDHEPGRVDASFRPNQIFAVGGLGEPLIDPARARRVVDAVEGRLLTPLGLRSLAPGEPGYVGHYRGGPAERDAAYHQGTVWPWLVGPFVEAWLAVRGDTAAAAVEAGSRFLDPLRAHLDEAGLGHVSEIADAEPPFTPAGCPFQAWSLGELLRAEALLERLRAPDYSAVLPAEPIETSASPERTIHPYRNTPGSAMIVVST